MKCKICGKKTTIDDSIGLENFIVCNNCRDKLAMDKNGNITVRALETVEYYIFKIGRIRSKKK